MAAKDELTRAARALIDAVTQDDRGLWFIEGDGEAIVVALADALDDDPKSHRAMAFRAMHRRAQAAESRAIKAHRRAEFWADWATRRAMDEAGAPLLRQMVAELAESLAEAGVVPCIGSMNPHEDDLGRALVLVPSAKAGVDRIIAQLGGDDIEEGDLPAGWVWKTISVQLRAGDRIDVRAAVGHSLAVHKMVLDEEGFTISLAATGLRMSCGGRVFSTLAAALSVAHKMQCKAIDWAAWFDGDEVPRNLAAMMMQFMDEADPADFLPETVWPGRPIREDQD